MDTAADLTYVLSIGTAGTNLKRYAQSVCLERLRKETLIVGLEETAPSPHTLRRLIVPDGWIGRGGTEYASQPPQ